MSITIKIMSYFDSFMCTKHIQNQPFALCLCIKHIYDGKLLNILNK